MSPLRALYRHSLGLLTDLYQLTMAHGYWKAGMANHQAAFHLFFRKLPFGGGFALAAGLQTALEYLEDFAFNEEDVAYLATLTGNDGQPLFDRGFLDSLRAMRLECEVAALPEGSLVFPQEPLLRVTGPLWQAQLLETALLTLLNFQTLIATKAARVCLAAGDQPVLEFGLRRAQGVDGGLSASRAAYIGGCAASSNVLAGKLYGIPVKGTHAHSWVMSFDREAEAFQTYAEAMPNNCIFLVDTYDTLNGVRLAVETGRKLREAGHEMVGIRLDSGDLGALGREARKILDQGGFPQAKIVASNDLDEYGIEQLKQENAAIDFWGVGTRLVTAHDQPALGGVYKLTAIRAPGESWRPRLKLSDEPAKASNPGLLQAQRFQRRGEFVGDMLYDALHPPENTLPELMPFSPPFEAFSPPADSEGEDLLVPVFADGEVLQAPPTLEEIRQRVQAQLAALPTAHKRLQAPAAYPVGLEIGLHQRKRELGAHMNRA